MLSSESKQQLKIQDLMQSLEGDGIKMIGKLKGFLQKNK